MLVQDEEKDEVRCAARSTLSHRGVWLFLTAESKIGASLARIMAGSTIPKGNCLETPAEPAESNFCRTVKHKAYPVQKLRRSLLGLFRTWSLCRLFPNTTCGRARTAGIGCARKHSSTATGCKRWKIPSTPRICIFSIKSWSPTDSKSRAQPGEPSTIWKSSRSRSLFTVSSNGGDLRTARSRSIPCYFQPYLRQANRTQIRVPIDDTHTWIVYVHFVPDSAEPRANRDEVPVNYRKPFKNPARMRAILFTKHRLDEVDAHDFMAWETQGPILDRTRERLAASYSGVVHVSGNAQSAKLTRSRST